ncbi:hypothetical protein Pen02_23230 [Plantactinospora endophytica]|uniref:Secreted protein n=1 Tax=Plantactinospora endophytica TaxID=673535 RepID=A0ABQ4DY77_9ACTN|nr:hypothetical protein Pen02_23230 [Plantactinospora endophytica]
MSRLRGSGPRLARPASTSTATSAVATAVSAQPCPGRSSWSPAPGNVSASSRVSPATVAPAPSHCRPEARRPIVAAAIGSASTRVSTPSGCTTESGPYASAATCSAAPVPFPATDSHQPERRSTVLR